MAAPKRVFYCNECGAQFSQWMGHCAACQSWNSLIEAPATKKSATPGSKLGYSGANTPQPIGIIEDSQALRISTGIHELDRVLGEGLVKGSVILIGGDPGIGKSTLLLQTLANLSHQVKTLYVTGEESLQQVSMRAQRTYLLERINAANLQLLAETCIENILEILQQQKPEVVVIDSIQTMHTNLLQSAPGGVAQVRESAAQLVRFAKQSGTAVFLVGHLTKEGNLAGPRVLEHMVDTVLYFEGDYTRFRVIRAFKNRFGAVNEIGVFAMTEKGLKEVANPSAIFLTRHGQPTPGSAVLVTREGTRPFLVEIQALVDESHSNNPRRLTLGLDQNRLAMLLAVLHRHAGIVTFNYDVYVNVVGGVRINDTGADLTTLFAIVSSLRNRVVPAQWVVFGEIGLAGEIRPIPYGLERLKEAAKHGFTAAVVPKENTPKENLPNMTVYGAATLFQALEYLNPA